MIYQHPQIRQLGDCALAVEFGDEADLRLNVRALALRNALEAHDPGGITDLVPTMRALGILFDPDRIGKTRLEGHIAELLDEAQAVQSIPSRIIDMPLWYDDPGSRELAARDGMQPYLEYIVESNGLASIDAFIARHTSTDQWVAAVGWAPGCTFAYALDRDAAMTSPKLVTPRSYAIPERYVTLGGVCTSITPVSLPSGYRTLGRLAIDIYLPGTRLAGYSATGVLFQAGDRQRYRAIDRQEYEDIRARIDDGSYALGIEDSTYSTQDPTG
ncbi:MAG: carboxyltransferase domain-containing protein [Rhodobacteraceae bacterium]|jgi:urea carboxylase|nr:carboxyltransferase domain-containing protein [Paracoccaceae bacterium]